jgi:hypothetical protein
MKNLKLPLLIFLLFLAEMAFSQNTVTYNSLSNTINLASGVEGTVNVLVNCYGDSSEPIFLNALQSCGNNDGILSQTYTEGNKLTPGQNTKLRFKFKMTVTTDTQITYKFSTNGSCFQKESEMIKITVNYKAGSTTSPAILPEWIYIGSWPTISATITEGEQAPALVGTGAGNFTYQWYKTINGVFTLIPGATSFYYYPGTPLVTTKYLRKNIGPIISNSNEITITVIKGPPILNNTIILNGTIVEGSLPTGGRLDNSYSYNWYIIDEEDGDPIDVPDQSLPNLILFTPWFNKHFGSSHNLTITRVVTSGSQRSSSNRLEIPYVPDIENNIISINHQQVTGSMPTGGMGNYIYSWAIYYTGDAIDFDETTKDLDLTPYQNLINGILQMDSSATLIRKVTSAKSSTSNKLSLNSFTARALNQEVTLTSAVYPNPTSGSVNFTTSFYSNKEMEIIVYSEKSGKAQRIFKGTSTPNQIVKWDIPSNYPKGTYYYKIVSDNKEVKTGKILYQ